MTILQTRFIRANNGRVVPITTRPNPTKIAETYLTNEFLNPSPNPRNDLANAPSLDFTTLKITRGTK